MRWLKGKLLRRTDETSIALVHEVNRKFFWELSDRERLTPWIAQLEGNLYIAGNAEVRPHALGSSAILAARTRFRRVSGREPHGLDFQFPF